MIKNRTPYIGKIKLKFEKYPHYSGSKSGMLNKVHLDLGFTKLVSRLIPKEVKDGGSNVDLAKVALIEKYTGGKIDTHEWWVVKVTNNIFGEDVEENVTIYTEPKDKWDIVFHGLLENSFLSKDGTYIGSVKEGWWYYENKMRVCEDYPHGVAELITEDSYFTNNPIIEGYYGYSHRGGSAFKIGDRLFDSEYKPKEEDYPEWQWAGYQQDYANAYDKGDELDRRWMAKSGIGYVIPFKLIGPKEIENFDEAKQAAINLSKDLS